MSQDSAGTRPRGSGGMLSERYDTALLDLDGVVYRGGDAVPHAVDALAAARKAGMRLAYVTNNALRPPGAVAAHLTELGVPAEAEDVITSAQAVARLIADRLPEGAKVLVIGGEGLRLALRERGLTPVDRADDEPVAVAQGYGGPDMVWRRFWEASAAINRGALWFASNTDLTIPSPLGIVPGNGAAVEVVRIATGAEPEVAGKPLPPMHRETILRTGARRPLVVGDRLDTDIEGAFRGQVDSLLVLTGVTDARQLLAAEPRHRPTYVDADLRGLLRAQPDVADATDATDGTDAADADGGGFACGGWTASARGDVLVLDRAGEGGGDPVDGLRALCAAAWTEAGDGSCGLDAGKALSRLGW
ncbi:HAD hydrolase-like protein [Streptomyces sp. NRRL F-5126]|uniref:HAD hydrolase-like protein n=1 Tax=Streptomyces sp. NRRL F-5126 TaxID=1463857 RepID=UPI0004CB1D63|nr:HAD hydrolase-like protein [Streptomyces sp. NRRL F-5126]